jgi:membrane-bound lytic murein transglycosylase F
MGYKIIIGFIIITLTAFSCKRIDKTLPDQKTEQKLEQILSKGVLRVVTDFNSTSYFIYRGQPMGYQYEMLQELANHLGVKLEVQVNNDLEQKFNMLENDEVDLIAVNLTVTKERKEKMDFTIPHLQTRQVLVQRKPANWKQLSASAIEDSLIRNQLDLLRKKSVLPVILLMLHDYIIWRRR